MQKFQKGLISVMLILQLIGNDESQMYLIFQLIPNTFRIPTGVTERIVAWKSKGL